MAKKEGGKDWKEVLVKALSNVMHSKLEDFGKNFKEKLDHTKKVLVERFFSSILVLIAFIFLLISFSSWLIEYQRLTKTFAYLITAGIIFLFAFILKYQSMKKG